MEAKRTFETAGRERLRAVMVERGLTQVVVAGMVGVTQSMISRWLDGESRPEEHRREVIEMVLGIDRALWRTEEEIRELQRALTLRSTGTTG